MQFLNNEEYELSVILPCLNEEATVGLCVDAAQGYMRRRGLAGEVIVVDNGSRDRSRQVAEAQGARVIGESRRGYGRAIRTGLAESLGRVIIICDCDTTYDLSDLKALYEPLAAGNADMVIGDRFAGGMERGAMPLSHRWGVRWLSLLGRRRFHVDVRDFHCGLRGLTRSACGTLDLKADGMEFATEMIAAAGTAGLQIGQVPVKLAVCHYPRSSKLRTIRDGLRHMLYIVRG